MRKTSLMKAAMRLGLCLLLGWLQACGEDVGRSFQPAAAAPHRPPVGVAESSPYPPRPTVAAMPAAGRLGANLPPITDYSRTHPYVDLLHQGRRFGLPQTPWDEKALLAEDGWPVGDFGVFLLGSQAGVSGVAGTYHVRFNGQAEVRAVASEAQVGATRYDPVADLTAVEVDLPPETNQLSLAFTRTGPGIRNLRVIRPGYDPEHPPLFAQEFLAHIARFPTLRFMDWLRTNNNPVQYWSQRTTPARTHYAAAAGVPWEHVIALANQAHKDLWINVPAQADDDYVRRLAQMLKAELDPALRIYVEYSNEVWNSQFKQHNFNFDLALAEVEADPESPLAFDGRQDRATVGYRRIARRGKEISDLFRGVYGDAAMMHIVRPIYAVQVVNTYATTLGLEFLDTVYGPPDRYFYGMAVAPYFNLGEAQTREGLTVDEVLGAMESSVSRLAEVNQLEKNHALARWYGLPLLAYEGGADTFGPGSLRSKEQANLDPRMEGLCHRYLAAWNAAGGELFMWFQAGAGRWDTPYGTWELTPDMALTDTPKVRCIDRTLEGPLPPLQGRNRLPGRVDALDFAGSRAPYTHAARTAVRYLKPGAALDYLVLSPVDGLYRLQVEAAAADKGNVLVFAVDGGNPTGEVALPAQGWAAPVLGPPLEMALTAGFHTLRLTPRHTSSGFDLKALHFEAQPPRARAPVSPGR